MDLRFRPVDVETLGDFVALFERRGGPSYCWCMPYRVTPEEAKAGRGSERKPFMLARIEAGTPVGLLAYYGDEPVGWVSVAPRGTFRGMGGPEAEPDERIWSITCFYLRRERRGSGLSAALLAAAIAHATDAGATAIEAYPVDPDSPSYRHMGFLPLFAAQGFVEIGRTGTRRHVVRLTISKHSAGIA